MKNQSELAKSLELFAEMIFELGNPEVRQGNKYNGIYFYFDKSRISKNEYLSFSFKDISVAIHGGEVCKLEAERPETWGNNLFQWVEKMRIEFSQWVSEETERKQGEIEND